MSNDVENSLKSIIGNNLKILRLKLHKNKTRKDIAYELGLHEKVYGYMEKGEILASLDKILHACKFYGVTMNDILEN